MLSRPRPVGAPHFLMLSNFSLFDVFAALRALCDAAAYRTIPDVNDSEAETEDVETDLRREPRGACSLLRACKPPHSLALLIHSMFELDISPKL